MGGRWCYLATWRDAYSRRVVGWHLAAQMPTRLVLMAPARADAASARAGAVASFSRPGN